ncbi:hypothetical protein T01_8382 [Trichinella spiralis]|uniref:Uncharacterized protein n=1 Tax=Trichinella spiralis TaxID=6334 RepID=A0A0V1BH77_TRISP|nr:hypothetical protein T01_8382 [Trichinella spiralis]
MLNLDLNMKFTIVHGRLFCSLMLLHEIADNDNLIQKSKISHFLVHCPYDDVVPTFVGRFIEQQCGAENVAGHILRPVISNSVTLLSYWNVSKKS